MQEHQNDTEISASTSTRVVRANWNTCHQSLKSTRDSVPCPFNHTYDFGLVGHVHCPPCMDGWILIIHLGHTREELLDSLRAAATDEREYI